MVHATSDATASSIVGRCIVSAPPERDGGELWVLHGGRGTTTRRHGAPTWQRVVGSSCSLFARNVQLSEGKQQLTVRFADAVRTSWSR